MEYGSQSNHLTVMKWSKRVTWPSRPSVRRLAYSAFFRECIETASAIVSTSPDEPPVIRIRKLSHVHVRLIILQPHLLVRTGGPNTSNVRPARYVQTPVSSEQLVALAEGLLQF